MGKQAKSKQPTLYVCCGKACKDKHAKKIRKALEAAIEAQGLEDQVRVARCDCLDACKHAPVVKAAPSGKQFTEVRKKTVPSLVAQAFEDEKTPHAD